MDEKNADCSDNVPSLFEQLGGADALLKIVSDFVDRVEKDMMIGFFFRNIDTEKLKKLEFQFAAAHLGGPTEYGGRPLRTAHASHKIMGGQFNRRLKILEKTLRDHGVSEDVVVAWLAHNESLRAHITSDSHLECIGDGFVTPNEEQKSK